ncbi:MAG TPA: M4 family metallopeptidase [Chryseosolibacter sp.]
MCKCYCSIIPPFIESKIVTRGKATNAATRALSVDFRARRDEKIALAPLAADINLVPKKARRLVYDSQNTERQRMLLKRSESSSPLRGAHDVNTVYDNAGIIRDYFQRIYNYNSWDDQGSDLILNIHYSANYNNAFWDGDEMTFGDGDGKIFISFIDSIDVTAHELAHGVVQSTAGLIYQGQPGALNEHFADVFGSVIKQFVLKQSAQKADWLIGDTIMGPSLKGQAIRSLKDPGNAFNNPLMGKDPQPSHMKNYYSGPQDHQGVHINSGIPNKVFYLVSLGITTKRAGQLWFETLKNLSANTNFKQFKVQILKTARAEVKKRKLAAKAIPIIEEAFKQVGL